MILTWMLYALLVSLLLAVSARALEEVCRLAGLPVRFIWLGALLATLSLVALAPLRTVAAGSAFPAAGIEPVALPAAGALEPASVPGVAELLGSVRSALEWPLHAASPLARGSAGSLLAAGWLALSLALLVLGAATLLRYRGARRAWPRRQVAGMGVRVAPASGPAVVGLFRPEIVVPEWLLRAPAEEQRLVVLHEREHLRTRDPLVLAAGCLAVMLLPWNPVAWWMLLRLRLAVELDCDTRVLRGGVRPQAYGLLLIDMAGRGSGLPLGVAALAGSPSTLERRLLAMTRRLPRFALVRAAALGVLGSAALLAACDTRLPTSAEVETMDVAAAETQARRFQIISTGEGNVRYIVDGKEVSAEEARALLGDRIAQVELTRQGEQGHAVIRIQTRDGDPARGAEFDVMRLRELATEREREGAHVMVLQRKAGEGPATVTTADTFTGMLLIDGVQADAAQLRALRPDQIERVEVLKGDAAARAYDDPRAAQGVIRITTKSGATSR